MDPDPSRWKAAPYDMSGRSEQWKRAARAMRFGPYPPTTNAPSITAKRKAESEVVGHSAPSHEGPSTHSVGYVGAPSPPTATPPAFAKREAGSEAPTVAQRKEISDHAEEEALSSKTPRISYSDVITVLVGPGEQRFVLHRDVVCNKSAFFRVAWPSGELTAEHKLIRLPEISSAAFQHVLDWIYSPTLGLGWLVVDGVKSEQQTNAGVLEDSASKTVMAKHTLCFVWDAAARLGMDRLMNAAMDTLLEWADIDYILPATICFVWERTGPDSALRRWLLRQLAACVTLDVMEAEGEQYPAEIYRELLKNFVVHAKPGDMARVRPTIEDRLRYHVHGDGEQ
ncbi:hypothetical protein B0A55_09738 [Friedmanniomyces simplex]|uniref:BTB domain-containing protein n=1 Tax=Friedmanniomyces simplex TaxID=329884 RepID=A0A4U0WL19_9PEZI|nr:hypothetical protein B0A55_09738 [Friedmanniomyces simplex]